VGLEIGGVISQASLVEFSDDGGERTVKQVIGVGVKPGVGTCRAVWEERLSRQRQMLAGMVVIDNLKAIGEVGIGQVSLYGRLCKSFGEVS
jgi:hypothetical protein